ncbi:MAG: restriction endonuclease subunit S, partial [Thiobacillaceae bacterium]|nr:restriction endonuclease subunit S [Thiobacillaceae bacterium]
VKSIGEIFEIVQGVSLKRNLSHGSDGVPFLRTSNVYWGQIDLSNISRMHVEPDAVGDRWLQRGDLLVCEGGEIGRAAVWDCDATGFTYQNHLHRLRPLHSGVVEPKFAAAWMEVGFLHRKVYEGAGNKTTIPNLSRARLAELRMPLPDIDEQREAVAILEAIDRKIDLHRAKRRVLEELFKALLHKLMTGEIRVADLDLSALEPHPIPHESAC